MRKASLSMASLFSHKKTLFPLFLSILIVSTSFAQSWQQRGSDITGKANSEGIGNSTSLSWDGKVLAIGASGANSLAGVARVYEWNGSAWAQKGIDLKGATGTQDQLGWSVSLDSSGKTLAVGAPYADGSFGQYSNSGYVKVYSWSGTAWVQKGSTIAAADSGENCGYSVSLSADGTTLAIGAGSNTGGGTGRGQVRIYTWSGTAWVQKGSSLNGEGDYDIFGNSVSLDRTGNKVAIGAPLNSGNGTNAGSVRVYTWSGTAWTQQGSDIDGDADSDNFGYSVSLSKNGTRLAVGAPQDFMGGYGYAKIYDWSGSAWVQKGSNITSTIDADEFGYNVSLSGDGNYIATGARSGATGNVKGRAEVYGWGSTAWTQQGSTINGKEDYGYFGNSVTMNYTGDVFAVSEPSYSGSGSVLGGVRVYRFAGPCTPTSSTTTISACGTYTWNSKAYTASGTYKDTITNAEGCDSVMTLNLTIFKSTTQTIATAICGNDPYTSPSGKKYNASGVYSDTLRSKSGCDSIIYSITVTKKIPNVDGLVLKDSTITPVSQGEVAHGDIDNDGDEDFLISGLDASNQLIAELYKNDGSGNFTKVTGTSFTGATWGSASIVDVNGDNIPEIFITGIDLNQKPVANMYQLYQGSWLHVTSTPFNTLTGTRHKFADVDKDGDQDLLISVGDSLTLYKNTQGDFTSTPVIVSKTGAGFGFILTGDLNGDGYVDIIKSRSDYSGNNVMNEVLLNNSGNSFTAKADPFENLPGGGGSLADFNKDGKLDFILNGIGKGWSMVTHIYTNDGNGGFTSTDSTSIKGYGYGTTTVEDFNNDGTQDVLITGSDFSNVQTRLYIKNNKGNFVIASKLPVMGLMMSAATAFDMDNDGIKDLLITGQNSAQRPVTNLYKNKGCFAPCESETEITVKSCGPYKSPSGNSTWTESGTYTEVLKNKAGCDSTITIHLKTSGYYSMRAVACDSFKAPSGKVYYKSGNYSDTLKGANQWGCDSIINVNLNISNGKKLSAVVFSERKDVKLLGIYGVSALADLVGDNQPDILVYGDTGYRQFVAKLYKNNGHGNSFTETPVTGLGSMTITSMAIADMDGDSKLDILVNGYEGGESAATKLYKNNGGGSFSEMAGGLYTAQWGSVAVGDLDGDNKPEMLITGWKTYPEFSGYSKLYKNNGGGSFTEMTGANLAGAIFGITAITDLDGDNRPDILIAGENNDLNDIIKIYKNNSNGSFTEMSNTGIAPVSGGSSSSCAIADVDGDGRPEILISGSTTKFYKNNGGGSFTEMPGISFQGLIYCQTKIADMDGDNRPDIFVKASSGTTKLYINNGDGSFTEVTSHNLPNVTTGRISVGYIDGDNKLDVLLSGRLPNQQSYMTKLYHNISGTINASCMSPTGCNSYTSPSGKYTWTQSGVYQDTVHLSDHDSVIIVNLLIDKAVAKFTKKKDANGQYSAIIVNRSQGTHMSYLWKFGDGDSSTAVTPTHTYQGSGPFHLCLTITTGKGCKSTYCQDLTFPMKKDQSFTISVEDSIDGTSALGIEESPVAGGANLSFNIYPNPATHTLNVVNNESDEYDMVVRDLSGRQVASLKNQYGKTEVDMSTLKPGMYFIEIQSKNRVGYYKVLKQ